MRRASNGAQFRTKKSWNAAYTGSINEGARILEDGIAQRAVDIDITYIYGYGFPAWRGGPMFYADTVGLPKVLARIEEFEKKHGSDLWTPAPLLKQLAAERAKSSKTSTNEKKHSESSENRTLVPFPNTPCVHFFD